MKNSKFSCFITVLFLVISILFYPFSISVSAEYLKLVEDTEAIKSYIGTEIHSALLADMLNEDGNYRSDYSGAYLDDNYTLYIGVTSKADLHTIIEFALPKTTKIYWIVATR